MRPLTLLLALCAACEAPRADLPFDSDGDGLMDDEEEALGTDPSKGDSDGDGYDDGEEVAGFTDPADKEDHPYAGGWAIDSCRSEIQSTGSGIGDIAANFELTDQFGETLRLHDFCARAVVLDVSAQWCGSCQAEAPEMESFFQQYKDQGLMVITLLGENNEGGAADADTVAEWVEAYGLNYAVVQDPSFSVSWSDGYLTGSLPGMNLLAPGLEIVKLADWVYEDDIQGVLPQ